MSLCRDLRAQVAEAKKELGESMGGGEDQRMEVCLCEGRGQRLKGARWSVSACEVFFLELGWGGLKGTGVW